MRTIYPLHLAKKIPSTYSKPQVFVTNSSKTFPQG